MISLRNKKKKECLRNTPNSLYTGGLFHCYMLNKAICHFKGVAFILFLMKNPISKQCRPKQMPHNVASVLGLHCLPMTLLRISR